MIFLHEDIRGKVVLISGGTRGIGRACAIELAKQGAFLGLIYYKDDNSAKELENILSSNNTSFLFLKGDVSNSSFCCDAVNKVVDKFGKIDILINNAAISKIALLIDSSFEEINEMINTNLGGVINLTKASLPSMIARKKGNIINITSMWGEVGASCETVYSATKGGVIAFTKALSKEMGYSNIRVNAISPGVVDTDMNNHLTLDEKKALSEEIPLGRFAEASEIAKAAAFLCSDDSSYITGSILDVNGGII